MANKRPAHRKGTTGREYRKAQAWIFKGKICARCGNTKGPIMRIKGCQHPTHQQLPYCPTHPLAPSLGHKQDLQFGGPAMDSRNHQLEHYSCNSSAGNKARLAKERAAKTGTPPQAPRASWTW